MKVGAHMNFGPFNNGHDRFDTIGEAIDYFRSSLDDLGVSEGDGEHYTIDLSPMCTDCNSAMNFHDYPMARYELGPRGGIGKVCV